MKVKTLVAAILLTLAPALVSASCSGHSDQAMSCAQGSEYDPASGTCKVVTG